MSLDDKKDADLCLEDNAAADFTKDDAKEAILFEESLSVWQNLKTYRKAVLWSLAISLTLVMEGYDKALIGNFWGLPAFSERYGVLVPATGKYTVEAAWQTGISQAATVGSFIGIILGGYQVDRWGYRITALGNVAFMIPAIALVTFAPDKVALMFGELMCGLPWGVFATLGPSYASEVCPVGLRAYLTTYVNLCWVMGQFLASGVVLGIQGVKGDWAYRLPFALQWFWPCVLLPLIFFAPESPWWLVRKERLDEAERSVRRLGSQQMSDRAHQTVAMMVRTNQLEIDTMVGNSRSSWFDCFKGTDLRRTEISALAWGAQIISGNGFAGYVVYFFQQAGLSTSDSFKMGLGNTAAAFVGTVMSWFMLKNLGRRTIFVGGLLWLATLWLVIGGLSVVADQNNAGAKWGQAVLFLVWVMSYDFTIGPIAYCIVGETSSTRLRNKTIGISRNTFYLCNIVAGTISPYMLNPTAWNWRGKSAFFWAPCAFAMAVWGYFRLPEMKGRSYYELDVLFEQKVPARRFKQTEVALEDNHGATTLAQ